MSSCALPEPPRYEPDDLVEAWLTRSEAHESAHNVDRFARYVPELGWRSILAVLELPDAQQHLSQLADALRMLISGAGPAFIDRIEAEAAASDAFRRCLAEVHPHPTFRIPEALWARLSAAAGTPIGPMSERMAALYAEMPDLAWATSWDPHPLAPEDAPTLGAAELRAQAEAWLAYHQTFWSWEELHRLLSDEGLDAAWPFVIAIIERGSEHVLGAIGASILEDMIQQHGDAVIERIEERAAVDPRFRYALSHVWEGDVADTVWERVVRARGDEPQRG